MRVQVAIRDESDDVLVVRKREMNAFRGGHADPRPSLVHRAGRFARPGGGANGNEGHAAAARRALTGKTAVPSPPATPIRTPQRGARFKPFVCQPAPNRSPATLPAGAPAGRRRRGLDLTTSRQPRGNRAIAAATVSRHFCDPGSSIFPDQSTTGIQSRGGGGTAA